MSDFAKFGRDQLIWFPEGQIVRWHVDGKAPYETALVIRTSRSRVLIRRGYSLRKPRWVPNLHISHYEDRAMLELEAKELGWTVPADQPVRGLA